MTYSRHFILAVLFLITALTGCRQPAESGEHSGNASVFPKGSLRDLAGLLSDREQADLQDFLDSLQAATGVEYIACTVGDPGEGGLTAYAQEMTSRIVPGHSGLNNGAIIYVSDVAREVKIEPGHGLEWFISDTLSGIIIGTMRGNLQEGNYYEAFIKGFLEMAFYTDAVDWVPDHQAWPEAGASMLHAGDIVMFSGKGRPRSYQEGVPEQVQFHPNYFIRVIPEGSGEEVPLYFSRYMRDLVDRVVYDETNSGIRALVLETLPLRLALLGLDD